MTGGIIAELTRDPALRLAALALMLVGAHVSAIAPYYSLIAIEVFGLSNLAFGILLAVSSVVAVGGATILGIVTDQRANRRTVALVTAFLGVAGTGAVAAIPHYAVFVLAHAIVLPLGGALYGQLFAMARLAVSDRDPATRDALLSAIRAAFALPFVAVLPLLSAAITAGVPVMSVYPASFLLSLSVLVLIWTDWPRDGATRWSDRQSGLSLRAGVAEMVQGRVSVRVGLIGVIGAATTLYMALAGLIFEAAGRPKGDVALYVGLVAGLEVPVMLSMRRIIGLARRTTLIAAGTAIYILHLVLLAPLASTALVWLLVLPGAFGGAILISLPIAYLQDLLGARPGAGSSLLSVQRIFADGTAAIAFVAGTALAGYGAAALIGAGTALLAAVALVWIDAAHGARSAPVEEPGRRAG